MPRRLRTLLLAGAALFAVPAAAQTTLNGSPSPPQGVMKITCTDANNTAASPCFVQLAGSNTVTANQGAAGSTPWPVSWTAQSVGLTQGGNAVTTANPLPVTVVGGANTGSVTAAGTNGTQAQAVQGITGGVPQNSYPGQFNATPPTLASGAPGYLAIDSNGRLIQSPGASVSVSNLPATTGPAAAGTAAAAAALGGLVYNSTPPAPSNGQQTALQGDSAGRLQVNTVTAGGSTAALQTTGNNSLATIAANTGSNATAANQATEIAAITTRLANFTDLQNVSVGAGGTGKGAVHDVGAPGAFSRASATGYSSQGGTLQIYGCPDSACGSYFLIQSAAIAAGGNAYVTASLPTRYWQVWVVNGSATTATIAYAYSAQTAN